MGKEIPIRRLIKRCQRQRSNDRTRYESQTKKVKKVSPGTDTDTVRLESCISFAFPGENPSEKTLPLRFNFSSNNQAIDESLVQQIYESRQIRLPVTPLIPSVHEHNVIDSQISPFLKLAEFSTNEVTLIHGITHLAAAICLSPVFLDLPNHKRVCESTYSTVEVPRRDV